MSLLKYRPLSGDGVFERGGFGGAVDEFCNCRPGDGLSLVANLQAGGLAALLCAAGLGAGFRHAGGAVGSGKVEMASVGRSQVMAIIGIILLLIAAITILTVVLSGIVMSRMGYSKWAGLLFAFPFFGIVALWFLAFSQWPLEMSKPKSDK
ncbi:hypothetical protein HNO92_003910 [Chromobacterium alkanivorans]|uniref:hypothetical protein n=1 Tax=Chromobacterium alkanivorans TaxID=1071719 RepID=UPI00216973AD|nr:hypothetical protein [Chromobacterium alkanivorans]MCS3803954.1 hypothetical protein [Chromobacterium alkanivorans]MCS3817941.1 hypothetical protein [Chromobacterium alkanivorans]MCS3875561.1 hypothetical protein [Chromobacterium alkanivorans]